METINLTKPLLFLEFFVRSVEFHGKDKAKSIPPKTLHYLGKSLSKQVRYYDTKTRKWKNSFEKFIGFSDSKPVIKKGYENELKITNQTEGFCFIAKEYYNLENRQWFRSSDKIVRDLNANLPYGFNIKSIDKDGNAITDFPRGETPLIKNKVYAYVCHSEEYQPIGSDSAFPNRYIVLFVKNCGFHDKFTILSEREFHNIDSSNLCISNDISVRDYRKSKFRFSF